MLFSKNMKIKDIFERLTNDYDVTINDIYEDIVELTKRLIELEIIKKK